MDTAITFSLTTTSCPHRVNKGSIGTHTTAQNVKVLLEFTLLQNSSYSITTTQNLKVLGAVVEFTLTIAQNVKVLFELTLLHRM